MEQIAWEMRYGLPNQKYLKFVGRDVLGRLERPLYDPLALDTPLDETSDLYVTRLEAEDEVKQPGNRIIIGPQGTGKTTLCKRLPALLSTQTLVVPLPLSPVGTPFPESEWVEGKVSLLTPDILARYVFYSYWENLLRDHSRRPRHIPYLRQNRWWMATLRWFYHHYLPPYPEIPEEFELMAWLEAPFSAKPFSPFAPEDILRELIRFVTFRQELSGAAPAQPYARIYALIDGTERLADLAIDGLLCDMQQIHDLHLGPVQIKLFANSTLRTQIETLNCVRQGQVGVYALPQWSAKELRDLLYSRLAIRKPGEFVTFDAERDWGRISDQNWGTLLSDTLEPEIRTGFVHKIVDGALRVYDAAKVDLDAPIHVLRLARSLLAACAGCWTDCGFQPPLRAGQIEELINLYWSAG